ncbi:hypothetical protein FOTG_12408 [Fusarium oxysporum f. sp. vasinfectum 25433]|uniref:Secreted protein CSS2 C-terminal domain-containing protein n=1 Tax=Fusarium oxysporum f. sp. vasinfectum 25433 TaxID=1089449 RepID=X0LEK1_FUSOX|nr:hypothetical protein FOTG_12408 [Fusarium oxysporum f. sp. vasinfectum 25433]
MPTTEVTEVVNEAEAVNEAVKMPDSLALYHLEDFESEDFESEDSALEKRRHVTVCERIITITSHCVIIGGAIKLTWRSGAAIKHASNVKTCSTFIGHAGPNSNLFYRYRSTGRHCDTTAEQETIAGAIEHHIKNHGHKLCGTQCLELTHGGTWHGYLLIGPASNFDHKAYCGPEVSFKHCDSGGKGDIN